MPNEKDVSAGPAQFRVLRMYPAARTVRVSGRKLAVEDPGPDSGFPVIVYNGAGSRHLFPPAVAEAQDQGFRLIGYDRPGCGGSTAMPGRVIADCAADVQAIMTELGITRTAAWGSSGGGPYALAAAAKLPDVVTAVCAFASIGPYGMPDLDFCDGLGGDDYLAEIRAMLAEPEEARAAFHARSAVTPRSAAHRSGGCSTGETGRSRMLRTAGNRQRISPPVRATSCTLTTAGSSTTTDHGRTASRFIVRGLRASRYPGTRQPLAWPAGLPPCRSRLLAS